MKCEVQAPPPKHTVQASHISVILLPNVMITAMFCFPARMSMWMCVGVSVCASCSGWRKEFRLQVPRLVLQRSKGIKLHLTSKMASPSFLHVAVLHRSILPLRNRHIYVCTQQSGVRSPFLWLFSFSPVFMWGNCKIPICMLFICLQCPIRELSFFCLLCWDVLPREANKGCFYLQDAGLSVWV